MAGNGSLEDDIETSVWIDPKSGEDHSITVMQCGDKWWCYVDTTRISENCSSKEAAVEFAETYLTKLYREDQPKPAIAPIATAGATEATAGGGGRRVMAWLTVIVAGGAIAATAFVNRNVATDFLSSFAVAEVDATEPKGSVAISPPLPKRNTLDTASIKTASVTTRVKSVAVSSYQPTAVSTVRSVTNGPGGNPDTTGQSAANHNRDAGSVDRRYTRSVDQLQQYDKPNATSDQTNDPPIKSEVDETVSGAAVVAAAGTGLAARSLPDTYARTLNAPAKLKKRKSAKSTAGRRSKRKARRKARRRYRGRRMVSVRRVRIGNRVVKIVRFRRPRNLREFRRLQSARNRLIARYLRQRRRYR